MLDKADASKYFSIAEALKPDLQAIAETVLSKSGSAPHNEKLNSYDLVTELDISIEEELEKRLSELDPETPVVGEESGGSRDQKRFWLIDPLDGTIHFVRNNPFCTIMLAVIEDGIPIFSIVYAISSGDMYYAVRGHGAYKNGVPITTSDRSIEQTVVLTEINMRNSTNLAAVGRIGAQFKTMELMCAGYEFIMVADGRVEARLCLEPYGKDYDFASGSLLVQEAGGVVKDFSGNDYTISHSDMIIASNSEVYETLLHAVKEN